ncbi:glycosyltransferase family protein [Peribacillus psychrosaccharolyticus]|uniref:glycosyltransferase family protein n=1 Tax=Peribacillus psychrosaccharolyticus TaxID=1407 RepID=UPI002DBFC14E|nr:glycosyltransferase family protein [Peribacillus psychrosaccharolyticus]
MCFISCVNDEEQYNECIRHIQHLSVPSHVQIELLPIRNADSMASGYNEAMIQTDAKYKVYLHQDTMIINKNFLYDLLFLFTNHSHLGMFGVIGAKTIPDNGIWWESLRTAGKIIEHRSTYRYLLFEEADYAYQEVQTLDGVIMATQYDLPWAEIPFNGWHLYDTSQCLQFIEHGYVVGIPYQPFPWVLHECGEITDTKTYSHYLNIFKEWRNKMKES